MSDKYASSGLSPPDVLPGRPVSPWLERAAVPERPRLDRDVAADVAVVGAGIVGLTAALLLKRAGFRVAVLEGRRIAHGVSGNTTAKLTSLHGLTYAWMRARHGAEVAVEYGRANERGLELVAGLIDELEIDCDFRRRPHLTYTEDSSKRGEIEDEVEAAGAAGLPASYVEESDLPFEIAAAVRFSNQAEFDPVRYLAALADEVEAGTDAVIYEHTRATGLAGGGIATDAGHEVEAERIVVATHLPFLDRGGFFARAEPQRSYALSLRIAGEVPQGTYLSTESPPRSLRAIPYGDEQLWMVGGESHRIGSGNPSERFYALERYGRERFAVESVEHRWAAHDFISEDRLPYIGPASPLSDRALTVTGLRKWGLAMGSAAAEMLSEAIVAGGQRWPDAFDAGRLPRPRSAKMLVEHNAASGLHFVGDRLRRGSRTGIEPGQGRVVGAGLGQRAVYRDEGGELHELSARCTHLGCIVRWNAAERTWDCPCHGSRFGPLGEVVEGPAVEPLERHACARPRR
jgi:glycine/D-amino acid oxidase-like deaminating enzyme/nitrite reductase/ring-hydroxylating ferredoxin subunit